MPPEDQTQETPEDQGSGDAGAPTLTLSPDQIRNSPEFRALEKQNRTLARQKGTAEAAAIAARTEAENARQAAEAQRQAALAQQLVSVVGEDGIAAYTEIAELSASDPVAAATRLRELIEAGRAQSSPAANSGTDGSTTAGAGNVANANAQSQTPPPPSRGVDGGQPLGLASTGEDDAAVISRLEQRYTDTVARNQNMASRNRVTMKDRAEAMIGYLGAAYLKALGSSGARPRQ